jgi:endonuclease III-like protein 1
METRKIKKRRENVEHLEVKSLRKQIKIEEEENGWTPKNWQTVFNNIKEMRKLGAPVDTMGCDQCHDLSSSEPEQRFQILISLMLSSQTRDHVTHSTMLRLREKGLNLEYVLKVDEKELAQLLKPVSFYNMKAKHIKITAQILKDKFNGDIPQSVKELCSLPGVGPKMAYLAMQAAWNKTEGIGVDTHVHRISNRLGWVRKKTKDPEATRRELESWLPKDFWVEVNHALVGFGQTICLPRYPKCDECLNNKLCPSAFKT